MPTAWDETRFVGGTPETYVAVARRKGDAWYVGAMTNESARTVDIPLSFLGKGRYSVTQWRDGAGPNDVEKTTATVTARDHLSLAMAAAGGGAMVFTPVR